MFYTAAVTKEGKNVVLSSKEEIKLFAKQDIIQQGKEQGLSVNEDKIYSVTGKKKQGSTNTKFAQYRKANGGRNPVAFNKAL